MTGRQSILHKILLSTSITITVLFAVTGWLVQQQTLSVLSAGLRSEIRGSFAAYESLWQSRTETLRSVSLVLSSMSDVRAAFGTRDRATIRDTAGDIWSRLSQSNAAFLVCDPRGSVIASLGRPTLLENEVQAVRDARPGFPEQREGFTLIADRLYEVVVTPVYVQGGREQDLLNVLLAGFPVDQTVAADFKRRTGSDFVFVAGGRVIASTLPSEAANRELAATYHRDARKLLLRLGGSDFGITGTPLRDIRGNTIGDLIIARSFEPVQNSIAQLERKLLLIWVVAIATALGISFLLARRILRPVRALDQAAERIARQEYETRVPEGGEDELGRLARTFNGMCQSIQSARDELIRQERISTISRLSSSIVHDLRNPLAAIYGGAEMLVDGDLNEAHSRRIGENIYRASRSIKDMLQELVDVARGRSHPPEVCRLSEVAEAARDAQLAVAEQQGVDIRVAIPEDLELPLERARIERVFLNLIGNGLEAMANGGQIVIEAVRREHSVQVTVTDSGPGIPPEIRHRLFQPFATGGKNGLGLGLALSRQTVLDHGGDLWVEDGTSSGARFHLELPLGN